MAADHGGRDGVDRKARASDRVRAADHGNAETMHDPESNQPHTAHTLNPVPVVYLGRQARLRDDGSLQDIAPTLLAMMGVAQPAAMTGQSLIEFA